MNRMSLRRRRRVAGRRKHRIMKGIIRAGTLFLLAWWLFFHLEGLVRAEDVPGDWEPIAALTGSFSRLYFVDEANGWVVGSEGAIFHTSDGGKSWEKQESGTEGYLEDLYFANEKVGWAVGSSAREGGLKLRLPGVQYDRGLGNVILHTRDGGASWKEQKSGASVPLNGLWFLNETQGWAVGASRTVLSTQDGGEHWKKTGAKGWLDRARGALGPLWGSRSSQAEPDLRDVQFVNLRVGWIVGRGLILRTTDGGESWVASELELTARGRPELFDPQQVFFLDEETGWVVGVLDDPSERESRAEGLILHTKNGGKTWQVQYYKPTKRIAAIRFVDHRSGWAIGSKAGAGPAPSLGFLLYTTDAGETWTEWPQRGEPMAGLKSLFFLTAKAGWALSERGEVFRYRGKDE